MLIATMELNLQIYKGALDSPCKSNDSHGVIMWRFMPLQTRI